MEILAEGTRSDRGSQVAIRRSYNSRVDLDSALRPNSPNLTLLERSK